MWLRRWRRVAGEVRDSRIAKRGSTKAADVLKTPAIWLVHAVSELVATRTATSFWRFGGGETGSKSPFLGRRRALMSTGVTPLLLARGSRSQT
jgi:hypothetical protein